MSQRENNDVVEHNLKMSERAASDPRAIGQGMPPNLQFDVREDQEDSIDIPDNVDPNFWKTMAMELMKRIPATSTDKVDKWADRVAKRNPKVYDGKIDPVELEEWIRGMEKIFAVIGVPEEEKVKIGTFYLAGEADIWWSTVKDRFQGPSFTWVKFLEELRATFYPVAVQRQKEKEFLELKMDNTMTVIQYASKFMELSRFAPDYVATEKMKLRRFEEGLPYYIRNQLAGQPIATYQELYERATEVERVKNELKNQNPGNLKRKWDNRGSSSGSVIQEKFTPTVARSRPSAIYNPCARCGRTNHPTSSCRVGSDKCLWCGSPGHVAVVCPQRQRSSEQGIVRPFVPPRQGPHHQGLKR